MTEFFGVFCKNCGSYEIDININQFHDPVDISIECLKCDIEEEISD